MQCTRCYLRSSFHDITADEFLHSFKLPNESCRKLLYKLRAHTFMEVPPLIIQVTNLRCGGMILCTAISHCVCDGTGTSQFLRAWAMLQSNQILIYKSHHSMVDTC